MRHIQSILSVVYQKTDGSQKIFHDDWSDSMSADLCRMSVSGYQHLLGRVTTKDKFKS